MTDGTRNFFESAEELFALTVQILMDTPPQRTDAGYIFSETIDNDYEPSLDAFNAWSTGDIDHIVLQNEPETKLHEGSFVAGFEKLRSRLIKMGCDTNTIVPMDAATDKFPPSTDAESLGLVRLAKEQGWKTCLLFAPALHRFRVFVSTATAILKEKSGLLIYSPLISIQNWQETVIHSQSAPKAKRKDQIMGEIQKVMRYCAKGDHLPAKEILKYLDWRDNV